MNFLTDIETATNPAPIAQHNFELLDTVFDRISTDDDSLLINGATKPASLVGGIAWKNGTAPSADVTDQVSLWVGDRVAGEAGLRLRSETGVLSHIGDRVGFGTLSPLGRLHTVVAGANNLLIEDSSAAADLKKVAIRSTGGELAIGTVDDATGATLTPTLRMSGRKVSLGNAGLNPASAEIYLWLEGLTTRTSGTAWASNFYIKPTPTSASSATYLGCEFGAVSAGAQNFTGDYFGYGTLVAASTAAIHGGSGTMLGCSGLLVQAVKSSTGALTNAIAATLKVSNSNATGAITNGIALLIQASAVTGAITNRWAIKQEGAGDHNTFAGNVLIGTTTLPASLTKGLVLATGAAATGTVAAGEIAIWFDGTDLRARIGTTDYTFAKT